MSTPPSPELRAALAGVRGLILDVDGVLTMRGQALPGARDAVARLDARRIPYRLATNLASVHRESLAGRLAAAGIPVPPERIVTSLSATVDHVRRSYPGEPVFVLTRQDGLREFGDQPLMTEQQADAADACAAAVILGDGDDDLSFANLNRAFRLIRRGAAFIAMHHNGWWYTAKGETIDTGAFVAALEYATGRRARVTGKPAPLMFQAAFRGLAAELAAANEPRLRRDEVAMVGDHAPQDIVGARRAGLRGVLVLSGRTTAEEVAGLRGRAVPQAVAASVEEVVAALD